MRDVIPTADLSALAATVADLKAARELIKELQAQEKAAAAAIKEALGSATVGTIDGRPAVRLDHRVTSTLDKALVAEILSPEAFAGVLRHTPSVALRLV